MTLDFGFASFADKRDLLDRSAAAWNADKTGFWERMGVPIVIGERSGYELVDVDGHRLIDVHLNGGTYNLGHRNPELVEVLKDALDHFDMGNHHFASPARTALAERLVELTGPQMRRVAFGTSGSEAIDLAIKVARRATGRRKIVSIVKAYHGHSGLAVATGDARYSVPFLSDRPDEFVQVPFNDLPAMEEALAGADVAGVLMETIPATYGFPLPAPGYLAAVAELAHESGALYIADEVQTGLGRTGVLWGISKTDVVPDVLVTAKGLGGGLYPISAVVMNEPTSRWLDEDGFSHMSTAGGAELGSIAALGVLEITTRPQVQEQVHALSIQFDVGLSQLRARHEGWFTGIRQDGLVIGLELADPQGAMHLTRALYAEGVWAIFSSLDPSVLQFKPGLLLEPEQVDEILHRLDRALAVAQAAAASGTATVPSIHPHGEPAEVAA
ncbi:MAG: aspartate aminotransferase family protein [Solirubrobacteraceae bacterium]|nr:aspartate aminotransferase family protein [Solirubrobacteraceae bacterium]